MLRYKRQLRLAGFLIASGAALSLAACNDKAKEVKAPPPPSVTIAGVQSKEIRQSSSFVGQVAAVDQVGLVARVNGYLEKKLVKDGAIVKKGDLIFTIEKQEYQASLQEAKANVASAKADAALKAADEKRDKDLYQKGHVSEASYEATVAQMEQANAAVLSANASMSQAELNLSYTDVKAPFDGQIGKTTYSVGEVVGPTTEQLADLIRLAPVYVNFSVSESQYLNAIKAHGIDPTDLKPSKTPDLTLVLPNGEKFSENGEIVFIDNKVDPKTGTIAFRGQFANDKGRLVAGTYVTVTIEAPVKTTALVIPQASVQRDQRGSFVLAVNTKELVEQRYVDLGEQIGADFVVTKGLVEGERVIVEGLQKVRPGVPVKAVLATKPAE
ncbi:efflux RND transporter periplasmic adaptor subunit [Roseibium algae]|uniref:Efflux RND transporter periplasmic adaptor subunit n=1 Tax=Roseibium algae TaxID=3123038 RepID=A0ABU8TN46_9HYPH